MALQLPSLAKNGAVSFETGGDFDHHWTTYIQRGALPVKPERALSPLEQLDVCVLCPGLTTTVVLRVEVVNLQSDRALLRLLDPPPPKPPLLEAPGEPPSEASSSVVVEPGSVPAAESVAPSADVDAGDVHTADVQTQHADVQTQHADVQTQHADVQTQHPDVRVQHDQVEAQQAAPVVFAPEPAPVETSNPIARPTWEPQPQPPRPKERAAQTQDLDATGLLMPSPTSEEALPQLKPLPLAQPTMPLPRAPTPLPSSVLEPVVDEKALPKVVVAEPEPVKKPITMVPLQPIVVAETEVSSPGMQAPPPRTQTATAMPGVAEATAAPPSTSAQPLAVTPAKPQPLPPFFTFDALRFQSAADLQAARPHLESVGAVLCVADGKLPPNAVDVVLAVGERTSKTKVKVTLSAAAPGTAVVQCVAKGAFLPLLSELDQQNASSTQNVPTTSSSLTGAFTPVPGIQQRGFTLQRQGSIANPTTPEHILALPMTKSPSEQELATPSVPLLLRWLRTTRGTLRLEMTAPDHPVFTAVFVDGREVRTAASLNTLGKSLALPKMSYSIIELGRPPTMTTSGRTLHLIAETIRGLCAQVSVDDLARVFPRRGNLCPRAVSDIVAGLGLPQQHQRFIKTDVDGSQFLDEIARAAVGGRTIWETLYLLEIFNGLTWDEPPEGKKQTRTGPVTLPTREKTGAVPAPEDAAWFAFEGKDHFGVLGLHWSSSPTEVNPAFQKLKSEYGVNGFKRPQNAATADKIMKRLEEAFKVLNDPSARRAYRREKYNLVWSHQAQLLVQKAKLAIYRKDFQDAMNALLAAEDMSPSEEARALLGQIKQKMQGGSAKA